MYNMNLCKIKIKENLRHLFSAPASHISIFNISQR